MKVQLNNKEYILKQVDKTLIKDFTYLFNETKKQNVHPKYFLNKYSNPPGNSFYYGFLLYFKNKPVAHFGCIPYKEEFQGKIYRFAQLCDTVTLPEFQNNGLNKFLTEHLLAFLKEKDFNFVFSFANKTSAKIKLEKYNWNKTNEMRMHIIPVKSLLLNKILNKLTLFKIYNIYISFLCLFFNNTLRTRTLDKLHISHTLKYIKYKKYNNNYIIKLCKHSIWFNIEDGMSIGYTSIESKADFDKVMKKLKVFCFFAGFHQIKFYFLQNKQQFSFINQNTSKHNIDIVSKSLDDDGLIPDLVLYLADKNTF